MIRYAPIRRMILITGMIFSINLSASTPKNLPVRDTWLVVFVHGIKSIKPHVSISNFLRFMTDDISNTVYSKTVELMRNDPLFYQNQAMQGFGLQKIHMIPFAKGHASQAMAKTFNRMWHATQQEKTVLNTHYYTFGWTGLLSLKARLTDAVVFYNELSSEVQKFKDEGITPKIMVIGYSHGGNVCLNLAAARDQYKLNGNVTVDKLILLGMPVQSETDHLINDDMFERVYHLYSRKDRIQKLDFFTSQFASRRIFSPRKGFELPDKLAQIQIKCTRNIQGKSNMTLKHSPDNIGVISGKNRLLRDASPGHCELWFFGWTPLNYRKTFPLYPLPIASILPVILKGVNDFEDRIHFDKPTLIDIRPEHEIMIIKNQKSMRVVTIANFLPTEQFNTLRQDIRKYAPDNYTLDIYNGRINQHHKTAKDLKKAEMRKLRAQEAK